jgi:O-methyltransferase
MAGVVKSRPQLHRHALTIRHLMNAYRAIGGDLRALPSDIYLYEMPQRKELFRRAFQYLAFNGIEGDYAEFGCFGAMTFRMAWSAGMVTGYTGHLWGFDSFDGLPDTDDPHDRHPRWTANWLAMSAEEFTDTCVRDGVPADRFTVVPGFYADSLAPTAVGGRPERINFAYVDCDLHSSTVDVLTFLESRLVPGAVVAFDDWFCYSPTGPSGERVAALEHFSQSKWSLVPFVQYGWHGRSFLVEDRTSVPPPVGPW